MYSGERRRYSQEAKPEQYSPDTWDNPTKVLSDLKSVVNLARRFADRLINKLPQDPPRASSIE